MNTQEKKEALVQAVEEIAGKEAAYWEGNPKMQHHSYKLLSVGRLMPGNLWHKSAQKFQMRL